MKISEEQQQILDKAIELLKEYDKEEVSDYIYFFVVSEDDHSEIGAEYDCCDNPECYEKILEELRKEYPGCMYTYQDNSNDYESINCCYQCGKPLNDTLTWIEMELNYHVEYSIEKVDLQKSRTAFDVRVMFEAMPTCDYEIRSRDKKNTERLKEAKDMQDDFVNKVINYAEQVIAVLE